MIKLTAIGHIGKDAIINQVNGKSVVNFTVAHSERFKDAQGVQKERTTWIDCSYWSEKAGIVPYLKKGVQVYIEGQPDVRAYTTNDNQARASLVTRVSVIQLLNSKQQDGSAQPGQPVSNGTVSQPSHSQGNPAEHISEPFDDLPF